jgi:hypothetical protein
VSDSNPIVLPGEGENPAASAAMLWLQTLEKDRFDLSWATLTGDFRLYLIQDWIVNNPALDHDPSRAGMDRDELAATLATPEPTHVLWIRGAARVAERGLRGATIDFLAGREWGAGARQRPLGPDLELVRIFPNDQLERDEDGHLVFPAGAAAEVLSLLMTHVPGGWLVAGIGGWLPRPGWPPDIEMIASPED